MFRWSQETAENPQIKSKKGGAIKFIDEFVNNDPAFLKWTDRLKEALYKGEVIRVDESKIRKSLYRPFCKKFLYFDHLLNQRRYLVICPD